MPRVALHYTTPGSTPATVTPPPRLFFMGTKMFVRTPRTRIKNVSIDKLMRTIYKSMVSMATPYQNNYLGVIRKTAITLSFFMAEVPNWCQMKEN